MHHGMMTIYKEAGYTSSDAVARLRGILGMRKIGHTGTLDPDAEGVLPMCLGNATRICELIADKEKEYTAVMRLGVRTDTQDMSGNVLTRMEEEEIRECLCGATLEDPAAWKIREAAPEDPAARKICEAAPEALAARKICEAAVRFVGEIDQIPPMYSAIKVNGKRLYDLARKGRTVERKPRRITIYALEVVEVELPLVTIRVRCSRGTYIRTLCEDIGNALGTGAAMESLLRTRVGQFALEEARTLDEVERIAKTEPPEALQALIRPVDSFFADLPAACCAADAVRLLKNGNPLEERQLRFLAEENKTDSGGDGGASEEEAAGKDVLPLPGAGPKDRVIRVYDDAGRFYGLYKKADGSRRYKAFKMFLPEEEVSK